MNAPTTASETMRRASSGPWKLSPLEMGIWVVVAILLAAIFRDGLRFMVQWWYEKEEYSHGFLIPPIVAFLIWQKRDQVQSTEFRGSWLGVILVAIGLLCFLLGELSTIYTIVQYAFVIVLCGVVLSGTGWKAYRYLWAPLALLFLMIPLPNFFYHNLSASLQLLSSYIGVQFIRLFDISVLLSGNVIDLGSFRLQVVEACSGLRYLFPLVTLGIITANFFKAAWWKRLLLVLSTVPITVLMNSLRIGAIGVTVEYWGQEMAEGLLHDFEGWAVFMCCFAALLLEIWILNALDKPRRPFREVFAIEYPAPAPLNATFRTRVFPVSFKISLFLLVLTLLPALLLPKRVEATPKRAAFSEFPLTLGSWRGQEEHLGQNYIDELKFTDYLMANYHNGSDVVNMYIAYYASQRKGQSVHSPRSCLPGGGWRMNALQQIPISTVPGTPLNVNRAEIQWNTDKQIVYYWFEQRGRQITNEYLVKWYLLLDALTMNRSDGALVRLLTAIRPGEEPSAGDQRLQAFMAEVLPRLDRYIPR